MGDDCPSNGDDGDLHQVCFGKRQETHNKTRTDDVFACPVMPMPPMETFLPLHLRTKTSLVLENEWRLPFGQTQVIM